MGNAEYMGETITHKCRTKNFSLNKYTNKMIPKNIKILIALCLLTPINSKAVSRIFKKSLNYEDFLATIDLPKAWPKKAGKVTASNGQCLGRTRADQVGLVHCDYAIE